MFPKDKIIEIFSMCDDFSKGFDSVVSKSAITGVNSERKREFHRNGKMSNSEVMTFLILFHNSGYRCFKYFYLDHVCKHMRYMFPKTLSYDRFVELQKLVVIKLAVFVTTVLMGKWACICFINSTPLRVCKNQNILQYNTFKGIA